MHETATELGYVADPAALRLARKQNDLLGVHTFSATFPVDIESSYYPFLAGIEEQAGARGYERFGVREAGHGTGAADGELVEQVEPAQPAEHGYDDPGCVISGPPDVREPSRERSLAFDVCHDCPSAKGPASRNPTLTNP